MPHTLVQLAFLTLALLAPCQPQHSVILVEIILKDYSIGISMCIKEGSESSLSAYD